MGKSKEIAFPIEKIKNYPGFIMPTKKVKVRFSPVYTLFGGKQNEQQISVFVIEQSGKIIPQEIPSKISNTKDKQS